ncbi:MAG: hypothetical protein ACYS1A_06445 [Planctomycetota bacterium]
MQRPSWLAGKPIKYGMVFDADNNNRGTRARVLELHIKRRLVSS